MPSLASVEGNSLGNSYSAASNSRVTTMAMSTLLILWLMAVISCGLNPSYDDRSF